MGTPTRIICSNPKNIEAEKLQKKMVEQYGKFRINVKSTNNPSELEVSCTVFVEEEQFVKALQTLKGKYGIEILQKIWWFGEII